MKPSIPEQAKRAAEALDGLRAVIEGLHALTAVDPSRRYEYLAHLTRALDVLHDEHRVLTVARCALEGVGESALARRLSEAEARIAALEKGKS